MARFRRKPRGIGKPASAFAGGTGSTGRTLAWEALTTTETPATADNQFNNLAFVAGVFSIKYQVLVPVNLVRGALTVVRIRGSMATYFDAVGMGASGSEDEAFVSSAIMLTPIGNGVIQDVDVLNPLNSADLESNRILWRRTYTPFLTGDGGVLASNRMHHQKQPTEIDVKVKRRFDRANWALIWVIAISTSALLETRIGVNLRGLFLAPDGV